MWPAVRKAKARQKKRTNRKAPALSAAKVGPSVVISGTKGASPAAARFAGAAAAALRACRRPWRPSPAPEEVAKAKRPTVSVQWPLRRAPTVAPKPDRESMSSWWRGAKSAVKNGCSSFGKSCRKAFISLKSGCGRLCQNLGKFFSSQKKERTASCCSTTGTAPYDSTTGKKNTKPSSIFDSPLFVVAICGGVVASIAFAIFFFFLREGR